MWSSKSAYDERNGIPVQPVRVCAQRPPLRIAHQIVDLERRKSNTSVAMMRSSSLLLIALVTLLKNIEGERNTLTLKVVVGYRVAPVIATFSARK